MTQPTDEDRRMLAALRRAIDTSLETAAAEVTPPPAPTPIRPEPEDDLPPFVQDVIDQVGDGTFDPYLEILLSHLHNRKRRLRGTRGFQG